MIFLHPALLIMLPLAAVPIILHLLTLQRLRTVELSTYRFLFDSYVQQRRRMRLLELLLAVLRTLFLLLLIFALGRPVLEHWGRLFGAVAGRDVILLLDCSASMSASSAGMRSIDRAKRLARSVVQRLGPADRVTVYKLTEQPVELFSRFAADAELIAAQIEAI